MKRCLFIPTFNVATTVGKVLEDLALGPVNKFDTILIVDNSSQDQTIAVCCEVLRRHKNLGSKTELWRNANNYSLGGSTVIAIERSMALGMDYLINLHSDGQAQVQDVEKLADACRASGYPLILGSRLLGASAVSNYSGLRLWGNRFFAHWQKAILHREVSDLGALMALPLKHLNTMDLRASPSDMGYQPHLLMRMIEKNPDMEITEIPITWGKVEFSNVNPWIYGLNHFYRLLRFHLPSAAPANVASLLTSQISIELKADPGIGGGI